MGPRKTFGRKRNLDYLLRNEKSCGEIYWGEGIPKRRRSLSNGREMGEEKPCGEMVELMMVVESKADYGT